MRRRHDNWINATHILKAAGFDKVYQSPYRLFLICLIALLTAYCVAFEDSNFRERGPEGCP